MQGKEIVVNLAYGLSWLREIIILEGINNLIKSVIIYHTTTNVFFIAHLRKGHQESVAVLRERERGVPF